VQQYTPYDSINDLKKNTKAFRKFEFQEVNIRINNDNDKQNYLSSSNVVTEWQQSIEKVGMKKTRLRREGSSPLGLRGADGEEEDQGAHQVCHHRILQLFWIFKDTAL
jgi:hypothetical protein